MEQARVRKAAGIIIGGSSCRVIIIGITFRIIVLVGTNRVVTSELALLGSNNIHIPMLFVLDRSVEEVANGDLKVVSVSFRKIMATSDIQVANFLVQ
jgi:hypothetical protein